MNPSRAAGRRQPGKAFAHTLLFLAVCEAVSYSSLTLAADAPASDNPLDTVASTVLATAKSCLSCPPAADSISPQGGPSRRPMGTEIEQPSRMLTVL